MNFGKVLHLKNQIEIGLNNAESWMSKRNMMVCIDRAQRDGTALMVRRVVQDAGTKFETVSVESLHHLGFADLTKLGRLTAIDVDDIGRWCQRTLNLNPDCSSLSLNYWTFSSFLSLCCFHIFIKSVQGCIFFNSGMIFMIAPVLAGEGVLNGLRGEHRPGYILLYMWHMFLTYLKLCLQLTPQQINHQAARRQNHGAGDGNEGCRRDFQCGRTSWKQEGLDEKVEV